MAKVYPTVMPYPRTFLGYDGTDFRAAKCDANGQLRVVLPKGFTIDSTYNEINSGTASASGTFTVSLSTVPAGEFWRITCVSVDITTTTATDLDVIMTDGTNEIYLLSVDSPTSGKIYVEHIDVILPSGWYIVARAQNVGVGDVLTVRASGYVLLV